MPCPPARGCNEARDNCLSRVVYQCSVRSCTEVFGGLQSSVGKLPSIAALAEPSRGGLVVLRLHHQLCVRALTLYALELSLPDLVLKSFRFGEALSLLQSSTS